MKTHMKRWQILLVVPLAFVLMGNTNGCEGPQDKPAESSSGVRKTTAKVQTNAEGLTTEQQNIRERLLEDNKPGSVKHLYVISAYSGQVVIYSTVRGKVTSGGKRLTPTSIVVGASGDFKRPGFPTDWNNAVTDEVLQDDGTYGHSMNYLYWWDVKGVYHQHYVSGGQILHISNQPLAVKGIIINMEISPPSTETEKTEKRP